MEVVFFFLQAGATLSRNNCPENWCAKKKFEKKIVPKLDSKSEPLVVTACESSAVPSELQGGVDWAAHASMASVD